ncbi:MAG: DUF4384 domain-containing protein [Syntrophobacteraceae bacterium]
MKTWNIRLRSGIIFLLVIASAALLAVTLASAQQNEPDVGFRWAFGAMILSDGKKDIQPVVRDMTLKSGDQLKMMIELQKRCYVYLFHYNQHDGLKLLFPYSLQQFDSDYRVKQKYFIPRGEAWFQLDQNPGQESFHLVAASMRLEDLEKDYLRFESAEKDKKAEAARSVLDRIRALRKEHRELASPAERPVPIGGALRGLQQFPGVDQSDITALADEIASSGFVARTYTIAHE